MYCSFGTNDRLQSITANYTEDIQTQILDIGLHQFHMENATFNQDDGIITYDLLFSYTLEHTLQIKL